MTPPAGSVDGLGCEEGNFTLKECSTLATNKNTSIFARLSPKHMRRPEKVNNHLTAFEYCQNISTMKTGNILFTIMSPHNYIIVSICLQD